LISKDAPDLALELRWRNAHHALEFRTKRSQAGIADLKADFRDRHFTGSEQMARVLHATARKEVMGRLTESRVEQAMEVKGREAGFTGGGIEKNLRLKLFSQKITGAAEPAKSFVIDQPGRWMPLRHGLYCTEKMAQESNKKIAKKLCDFPSVFRHDAPPFI
jgi:hypothetical protein